MTTFDTPKRSSESWLHGAAPTTTRGSNIGTQSLDRHNNTFLSRYLSAAKVSSGSGADGSDSLPNPTGRSSENEPPPCSVTNESPRQCRQIDGNKKEEGVDKTSSDNKTCEMAVVNKRTPSRKVSFKVRNSMPVTRRQGGNSKVVSGVYLTTLSASKVAQLTSKFNQMLQENKTILEEPLIARAVRRAHSLKSDRVEVVKRGPSLKTKPDLTTGNIEQKSEITKVKSSLKKVSECKKNKMESNQVYCRAKIGYLETPKSVLRVSDLKNNHIDKEFERKVQKIKTGVKDYGDVKRKPSVNRRPSFKTFSTKHSGTVRAAIQIFEQRIPKEDNLDVKTVNFSNNVPKPKVPEKNVNLIKTKQIVIKNGIPKLKDISKSEELLKAKTVKNKSKTDVEYVLRRNVTTKRINVLSEQSRFNELKTTTLMEKCYDIIEEVAEVNEDKPSERNSFLEFKITSEINIDAPESTDVTESKNIDASGTTEVTESKNIDASRTRDVTESKNIDASRTRDVTESKNIDASGTTEVTESKNIDASRTRDVTESKNIDASGTRDVTESKNMGASGTTDVTESKNMGALKTTDVTKSKNMGATETTDVTASKIETSKPKREESPLKPNNSFLWRSRSKESLKNTFSTYEFADQTNISKSPKTEENIYDCIGNIDMSSLNQNAGNSSEAVSGAVEKNCIDNENRKYELMLAKTDALIEKFKTPLPSPDLENNGYEPLAPKTIVNKEGQTNGMESSEIEETNSMHSYEECASPAKYEDLDPNDGYEYCGQGASKDQNIYECLPSSQSSPRTSSVSITTSRRVSEPLPPKPDSSDDYQFIDKSNSNIYYTVKSEQENLSISNCYESIYSTSPKHSKKKQKTEKESRSVFYDDCSSNSSRSTLSGKELHSNNCYESVYMERKVLLNDRTLTTDLLIDSRSHRNSVISCDQHSNSLYNKSLASEWTDCEEPGNGSCYYGNAAAAASDLSCASDRSDEWIDISDPENSLFDDASGIVIVREKSKIRKTAGWSHKVRGQWERSPSKREVDLGDDSDSDHHYETLYSEHQLPDDDDYDSFESDTDSDGSFAKNQNDSGVDLSNSRLPDPPQGGNVYALTKLAASAGKQMQKLRRNWSLTKNDITKSLSRITKKKSDLSKSPSEKNKTLSISEQQQTPAPLIPSRPVPPLPDYENTKVISLPQKQLVIEPKSLELSDKNKTVKSIKCNKTQDSKICMDDGDSSSSSNQLTRASQKDKTTTASRKKYWSLTHKWRRSLSTPSERLSLEAPVFTTEHKPKSTFYLTEAVNVDVNTKEGDTSPSTETAPEPQQPVAPVRQKLKSIINQGRPLSPPPAPPDKNMRKRTTSWYAECEVFKKGENIPQSPNNVVQSKTEKTNACWYAEVGLYQENGNGSSSSSTGVSSSAENSGNSFSSASTAPYGVDNRNSSRCVSTPCDVVCELNEDCCDFSQNNRNKDDCAKSFSGTENYSDEMQKRLMDEPLYQFYNAAVVESGMKELKADSSWNENEATDGYEKVNNSNSPSQDSIVTSRLRPTAMQLVSPFNQGQGRTLWCEVPEVISSAILDTLTNRQKKLQEAKFEIITSEASYLNSLNVLCNHFIVELDNEKLLTEEEKQSLFGNVWPVKECSEKLLEDLESCWQNNILLPGICELMQKHAEESFFVYVDYCKNQIYLDRTLRNLKEQRGAFYEAVVKLESGSVCQSLPLHSFLMLPMQRITRLPLLADAVLKRLNSDDDEFHSSQLLLATLNKIVTQCNEGARRVERIDEFVRTWNLLEFPSDTKPPTVGSVSADTEPERWLIRSGEINQLISRGDDSKLTFGKKFSKVSLNLFLFTDLLVVTKKRIDDSYQVVHYCQRSFIEINSGDAISQLPLKDTAGKHLIIVTLLENHEGKTIEMLLSCRSESDRQRWIEALSTPVSADPEETLYEKWDCPQVAAMHTYVPQQPDELPLDPGDVVNVTRKMADGWYQGERIRDGRTGWFPGNHVTEIASSHVRARNLKQRYRLLALSGSYLESQRKGKG